MFDLTEFDTCQFTPCDDPSTQAIHWYSVANGIALKSWTFACDRHVHLIIAALRKSPQYTSDLPISFKRQANVNA